MLTGLPVGLLSTIASHISNPDMFNLRLAPRILCAGLADDFDHLFQDRIHLYTVRSLKSLVQISRVPRLRNAIRRLTVVVSQLFYRDSDAIQKHIEAREAVKDLRVPYAPPEQRRIYRSGRTSGLLPPHQTMSIPPPAHPWFSGSDWLALRDSIHEQCADLLSDALAACKACGIANFLSATATTLGRCLTKFVPRRR
jgi:hypothetical protein